jgi:hypothetical protein
MMDGFDIKHKNIKDHSKCPNQGMKMLYQNNKIQIVELSLHVNVIYCKELNEFLILLVIQDTQDCTSDLTF